jgi:hypothetical protein
MDLGLNVSVMSVEGHRGQLQGALANEGGMDLGLNVLVTSV